MTNENRRKIAGELRQKLRKLQDYWTEVHQICTRCSLIIAIERIESRFTIGQSVVECQSIS